jgi:hypothetical protein
VIPLAIAAGFGVARIKVAVTLAESLCRAPHRLDPPMPDTIDPHFDFTEVESSAKMQV